MVIAIFDMNSWMVVTISISILLITVILLLFCICWERKLNRVPQFYMLDENGLRTNKMSSAAVDKRCCSATNTMSNLNLLKRFSSLTTTTNNKANEHENEIFVSEDLPILKENKCDRSNSDLVDSIDVPDTFSNSILKIVIPNDKDSLKCASDGLMSCNSSINSGYTFYSTCAPLSRSVSRAETFVSIDFTSDTEMLMD